MANLIMGYKLTKLTLLTVVICIISNIRISSSLSQNIEPTSNNGGTNSIMIKNLTSKGDNSLTQVQETIASINQQGKSN